MRCEVCGEDAPFFSETYDPRTNKTRFVYLCEEHQGMLYDKVNDALAEIKAVKAIKEAMDDKPMPIIPAPILTPTGECIKEIGEVLSWLYCRGIHMHGIDDGIKATIDHIRGREV